MKYFGGKTKIAKPIAAFLKSIRPKDAVFYSPFCGGLSIEALMQGPMFLSDLCKPLVVLYQAYQKGWRPPTTVSEELYNKLKLWEDYTDPLTAFVGFGCSFSAKWFDGYARGINRNYAAEAAALLDQRMMTLNTAPFQWCSYRELDIQEGSLVYCDPPYKGARGYNSMGKFDTDLFWAWVREQSKKATIIVSEYQAPEDFTSVYKLNCSTGVHNLSRAKNKRIEHLFSISKVIKEKQDAVAG